jgi:hypothetical protein
MCYFQNWKEQIVYFFFSVCGTLLFFFPSFKSDNFACTSNQIRFRVDKKGIPAVLWVIEFKIPESLWYKYMPPGQEWNSNNMVSWWFWFISLRETRSSCTRRAELGAGSSMNAKLISWVLDTPRILLVATKPWYSSLVRPGPFAARSVWNRNLGGSFEWMSFSGFFRDLQKCFR